MIPLSTDPTRDPVKFASDFLELLPTEWMLLKKELQKAGKRPGRKNIHNLRIQIRQFMAIITACQHVASNSHLDELSKAGGEWMRPLGKLRDTQVQQKSLLKVGQSFSETQTVLTHFIKLEKKYQKAVENELKTINQKSISKTVAFAIEEMKLALVSSRRAITPESLQLIMKKEVRKVLRALTIINPDQISTIHRFRIRLKEFKYLTIAFSTLIDFPTDIISELSFYQTQLGLIQDDDVFLNHLSKLIKEDKIESDPVDNLQLMVQKQQHNRVLAFNESRSQIQDLFNRLLM